MNDLVAVEGTGLSCAGDILRTYIELSHHKMEILVHLPADSCPHWLRVTLRVVNISPLPFQISA